MHYVKQFHINGVDTKQVACIELHGAPNTATEGAVGVLGMDITSPTHEIYKCVAVNGSVYTWELLSAGMSIMSATETGEGALTKVFPYTSLRYPKGYLIKRGDLILDSEGYLYRVTAFGAEYCDTEYCGTHIGGIASGDKDYTLSVEDGKLQLVTESGNVVSEVDALLADEETIYRNPTTGRAYVMGAITTNDTVVRFFKGTRTQYNALTAVQKDGLIACITDEDIIAKVGDNSTKITRIINGDTEVGNAKRAKSVDVTSAEVKSVTVEGGADVALERNTVYMASLGDGAIMLLAVGSDDVTSDTKDYFSSVASSNRDPNKLYRLNFVQYVGRDVGEIYVQSSDLSSGDGEFTDDQDQFSLWLIKMGNIPADFI